MYLIQLTCISSTGLMRTQTCVLSCTHGTYARISTGVIGSMDFLRQTPIQAESRVHLKQLLENRQANGIFFSTMQKFEVSDDALSQRRNIVVMADEAHRGQYGLAEKVKMVTNELGQKIAKIVQGIARIIRNSLPKATYIGFTGTPISQKDRSTREVFGDYIDIYDMTQAVEDGATRPVYYESRVVHLKLDPVVMKACRVMILRLMSAGGHKRLSLKEINDQINELLKQGIQSEGVINLFSDVKEEFSLFDPKLLEEIAKMKEKNIAVEILKKLLAEQVKLYQRRNLVKSEEFSEMLQRVMNSYINGLITNEQVIQEMLEIAKRIQMAKELGQELGLSEEEQAFYDALTRPEAVKDFYNNDQLVEMTRELTNQLRRSRTIDWEKRDDARAKMRMMVKKLLKKYDYPPDGVDDALKTVLEQCELWTDNNEMEYPAPMVEEPLKAAEPEKTEDA